MRRTTTLLDHESYSYDKRYRFEFRADLFQILLMLINQRLQHHVNKKSADEGAF